MEYAGERDNMTVHAGGQVQRSRANRTSKYVISRVLYSAVHEVRTL